MNIHNQLDNFLQYILYNMLMIKTMYYYQKLRNFISKIKLNVLVFQYINILKKQGFDIEDNLFYKQCIVSLSKWHKIMLGLIHISYLINNILIRMSNKKLVMNLSKLSNLK